MTLIPYVASHTLGSNQLRAVASDQRQGDLIAHAANTASKHISVTCAVTLPSFAEKSNPQPESRLAYARGVLARDKVSMSVVRPPFLNFITFVLIRFRVSVKPMTAV